MNNNAINNSIEVTKPILVRATTRIFGSSEGIAKALGEKEFTELSPTEQVGKLGKMFREHVSGDKNLSAQLMEMIRAAILFSTGTKTFSEEELVKLYPYELELVGKISKKKIALARFKLELGKFHDKLTGDQKEDLENVGINKDKYINSKIRETFNSFKGVSSEVIDALWDNYNLSYEARLFLRAFNMEEIDSHAESLSEICSCNGASPEVFMDMGSKLPYLGINTEKIRREMTYESDDSGRLTGNYLDSTSDTVSSTIDSRNGFINPNWFLYDIDVDTAIKLWGPEKTKYIFGRYFMAGIEKMTMADKLQFPEFYNFGIFRIKIDEDAEGNKKKLVEMAQHIMEWEIPDGFTQENLSELVRGLKTVISDFRASGEPKRFDHPIQTRMGAKRYTGYFSGSKGFENTHIIDINPVELGGKRVLRFSTELGQDTVLFILIQISYFLKNKKLFPANNLWREVYEMYNTLSLEGVERFDPSSMKEQYDTLVQKVVWPLSREHSNEKGKIGKPHNTLLYGVYGTGKSQLLTHLLAERKFKLKNNKEINLEANVINIGIMEFADLLVKSVSGFRKRLSDIHENTGRPIILVIEDIDTIVKEQGLDSDPVSQAMTTLFEGVGSLPVTVIASTNNPEILPQRHLRPNRLDALIDFSYPVKTEILTHVLRAHWEKKGLDQRFRGILDLDEIHTEVLGKIKYFTPSHISAICLNIYEAIEFEDLNILGKEGVKGLIDREIQQCLVPVSDMTSRQDGMTQWRSRLGSNSSKMGF